MKLWADTFGGDLYDTVTKYSGSLLLQKVSDRPPSPWGSQGSWALSRPGGEAGCLSVRALGGHLIQSPFQIGKLRPREGNDLPKTQSKSGGQYGWVAKSVVSAQGPGKPGPRRDQGKGWRGEEQRGEGAGAGGPDTGLLPGGGESSARRPSDGEPPTQHSTCRHVSGHWRATGARRVQSGPAWPLGRS